MSGQRIKKPYVLEKYFPLPPKKYIVLQPFSKGAKSPSYWADILEILHPILKANDLEIVQVGGPNEQTLPYCYYTQGQTTWGQLSYIISNSKLVLSCDSISAHLAGYYDLPVVALYSTNYTSNVKPYFGNSDKQILLEPARKESEKPSFAYEEHPKTIDKIQIETVAKSVCQLLNLSFDYPYETIYIGDQYKQKSFESVLNNIINTPALGLDLMIVRLDYLPAINENALAEQLKLSKCVLVTDKEINLKLLEAFKANIHQIVYVVKEDNSSKFVNDIQKLGIKFELITELNEEKLKARKLDFMDFAVVHRLERTDITKLKEFEGLDLNKLWIKSSKFILSEGKIYLSKYHWLKNIPTDSIENNLVQASDDPELWKELKNFRVLKNK